VKEIIQRKPPPKHIIIVSVDEKSIREIGRLPWSRKVIARLINKIYISHKVIGIDIMFSERENRASDEKLAKAIEDAAEMV
jgi:adenylate cyclase